jgi:hypothetical protein
MVVLEISQRKYNIVTTLLFLLNLAKVLFDKIGTAGLTPLNRPSQYTPDLRQCQTNKEIPNVRPKHHNRYPLLSLPQDGHNIGKKGIKPTTGLFFHIGIIAIGLEILLVPVTTETETIGSFHTIDPLISSDYLYGGPCPNVTILKTLKNAILDPTVKVGITTTHGVTPNISLVLQNLKSVGNLRIIKHGTLLVVVVVVVVVGRILCPAPDTPVQPYATVVWLGTSGTD